MTDTVSGREWLDGALLDAHARNDAEALIELYEQAGFACEQSGDEMAACFYYTHAYIFALEEGAQQAASLKKRLIQHGRDR